MKVSIIIPNWNGMKWLPACMKAIFHQTFTDFEVIVVDNASEDDSVIWMSSNYPNVALLKLPTNKGFSAAVNAGIEHSTGAYLMLLNTDTELDDLCLGRLVKVLEDGDGAVGAVSPLMLSMSDRTEIDDAGDRLSWYGEASKGGYGLTLAEYELPNEIFSPSGGASLYRRTFFNEVGLFDEQFFAYLEDVDVGFRGKLLGFKYLLVGDAIVYHKGHGSEIEHDFYITLVTKNRLLLFFKNVPFSLLLKHGGKLLYGQIYFLLAYGHLFSSIRGYWGLLKGLPSAWRSRRVIQSRMRLSTHQIDLLLNKDRPGEGIMFHLKKLWQ